MQWLFFLIKKYKNVNIFSISNILYRKKAKKVKSLVKLRKKIVKKAKNLMRKETVLKVTILELK